MRKDHHKLLNERERKGSYKYHDIRHLKKYNLQEAYDILDDDDNDICPQTAPVKRSMRKIYRSLYINNHKIWRDQPIHGLIRKNIGRKWNDVYSEFCAAYDQRKQQNRDLHKLLMYNVTNDLVVQDGQLFVTSRYIGTCPLSKTTYIHAYVDPRDGILKYNPDYVGYKAIRRKYRQEHEEMVYKVKRIVDAETEHHLINNIWFELKLMIVPKYKYGMWKDERVVVSKRTLSKKELRTFGLTNT